MDEYRNRGSPRLQFSKEELENDVLSRPIAKAEKAADKYDAAKKKLNKKRLRLVREEVGGAPVSAHDTAKNDAASVTAANESMPFHTAAEKEAGIETDPHSPSVRNTRQRINASKQQVGGSSPVSQYAPGIAKTMPGVSAGEKAASASVSDSSAAPAKKKAIHLRFEETQAKRPSALTHSIEKSIRSAGDQLHRQAVRSNEDENVAVEAVLKADDVKESALQTGEHAFHAHKVRQSRRVEKTERKLDRANVDFLQAKYQQEHPQFTSNPLSRWQQKRAIRKEYAAAKRGKGTASRTAKSADKAVEKASDAAGKAVETVRRHPTILLILALGAMLLVLVASLQSCSPLVQSVLESIVIGTYPAEEADVRAAERAYAEKERQLKDEMDHKSAIIRAMMNMSWKRMKSGMTPMC